MDSYDPLRVGVNKKSRCVHFFLPNNISIGCGNKRNEVTDFAIACKEDYFSGPELKRCATWHKRATLPHG